MGERKTGRPQWTATAPRAYMRWIKGRAYAELGAWAPWGGRRQEPLVEQGEKAATKEPNTVAILFGVRLAELRKPRERAPVADGPQAEVSTALGEFIGFHLAAKANVQGCRRPSQTQISLLEAIFRSRQGVGPHAHRALLGLFGGLLLLEIAYSSIRWQRERLGIDQILSGLVWKIGAVSLMMLFFRYPHLTTGRAVEAFAHLGGMVAGQAGMALTPTEIVTQGGEIVQRMVDQFGVEHGMPLEPPEHQGLLTRFSRWMDSVYNAVGIGLVNAIFSMFYSATVVLLVSLVVIVAYMVIALQLLLVMLEAVRAREKVEPGGSPRGREERQPPPALRPRPGPPEHSPMQSISGKDHRWEASPHEPSRPQVDGRGSAGAVVPRWTGTSCYFAGSGGGAAQAPLSRYRSSVGTVGAGAKAGRRNGRLGAWRRSASSARICSSVRDAVPSRPSLWRWRSC